MNHIHTLPPRYEMEQAVSQRDRTYDGIFYFAVRSTSIFCRPGCASRQPKVENLEFFASPQEALGAGYRPCQRCRPLAPVGQPPAWVEQLLQTLEQDPTQRLADEDLRQMGVDPARARRYFRQQYGVTFQEYARRRRLGQALTQLRSGADLDDVALGNGFESHSGFRDAFGRQFGQPPGSARQADCIFTTTIESPLGLLVAGALDAGICLLEFSDPQRLDGQLAALKRLFDCPVLPGSSPHLDQLRLELAQYFSGQRQEFTLPLIYPGSDFQRQVWDALQKIPYGETRSYEQIAQQIGAPKAVRAVGTTNGRNRMAIIIPCHRVVNKDGKLGGYGGGLWRKQWLLDLERGVKTAGE